MQRIRGGRLKHEGSSTRTTEYGWPAWLPSPSSPTAGCPQHVVRVIKYADTHRLVGTRQNITADHRLSAPLSALIPSVRERIIEVLPTRRALTADGTFQTVGLIPEPVWLEAVVNAIIHRSYSNAGDHIRVEVFEDAIAVESPGASPEWWTSRVQRG